MIDIGDILRSCLKAITGDEASEDLAQKRYDICMDCPVRVGQKCAKRKGGCGCYIPCKIRSNKSKCPKNKW
jgi:hypothetical protein